MADQFVDLPLEGSGSGGVTSINTLTGAVTLLAGSNITITPSGNNLTIASTASGGANFPHNTDIVDMTGGTGSVTASLANTTLNITAGPVLNWATQILINSAGQTTLDWGNLVLYDSGGTSVADWDNQTLYDSSGVPSLDWTNRYLKYSAGNTSIDWQNSFLYDQIGRISEDYNQRYLYDLSDVISIDWQDRFLNDTSGINSIEWNARTLSDGTPATSVDYGGRYLVNSGGLNTVDWGNSYLRNNSGTSVDWGNAYLYNNSGQLSLDWQNDILYGLSGQPVAQWANDTGTFNPFGVAVGCSSFNSVTNGQTLTPNLQIAAVVLHPSGGLIASATLNMPFTAPVTGQIFIVTSDGTITSFTLNPQSGQTLVNAPTTITKTTPIRLIYNSGTASWFSF